MINLNEKYCAVCGNVVGSWPTCQNCGFVNRIFTREKGPEVDVYLRDVAEAKLRWELRLANEHVVEDDEQPPGTWRAGSEDDTSCSRIGFPRIEEQNISRRPSRPFTNDREPVAGRPGVENFPPAYGESRHSTKRIWVFFLAIVVISILISAPKTFRRQMTKAPPTPGRSWHSPTTGVEFVWIDPLGVWVGKHEVRNVDFRLYRKNHDSGHYTDLQVIANQTIRSRKYSFNGDSLPVTNVNFHDGVQFANWLTNQDRESGKLPPGYRYRLPTAGEYQACMQVGDGRTYPWGSTWPPPSGRAGNYADTHFHQINNRNPHIETYRDGFQIVAPAYRVWRNPWGLYGVGGNVWEATASDSSGIHFSAWMGGGFNTHDKHQLRADFRITRPGGNDRSMGGFRLVLSL